MLYIRTDMNVQIATGHVMRCLSIADATRELGEKVIFLLADNHAVEYITERGYETIVLGTKWDDMASELPILLDIIKEKKIQSVLIDSYQVTETYLKSLSEHIKIAYLDDLNAIVSDKIDGIMLPKAHVSDIKELGNILTDLENKKSLTKKIKIIPIVELAESLLEVETMVFLDRVDGILLGAEDFSSDLEVVRTKEGEEIFYARSKIAVACCAAKIDAIDTPFTDTKDNEGLEKDCLKAIKLGMKAKSCIHPNQIETVNEKFAPDKKTIEWAHRILEAKVQADQKGLGAFSVDGKMVDKPIIERAQKILKKAEKYKLV